jgi:hypothetical protein
LSKPHVYVPTEEIQRMFNEAGYEERARRGDLTIELVADGHPSRPKASEPYCTRSQMVRYRRRDGIPVALAHRYLRKDGTLGASGKPDPKRLYLADRIVSPTRE